MFICKNEEQNKSIPGEHNFHFQNNLKSALRNITLILIDCKKLLQ